ncbi:MAG: TetR/AcrR family transcriptional regulator [Thermodesulfobacteriota bacterium]
MSDSVPLWSGGAATGEREKQETKPDPKPVLLTSSDQRLNLYQTVGTVEARMVATSKGEKTRARVLAVARELINQKGFRSTSVNDIIEASGVKKGNLYFHFAGKEELGLAVLGQAHKELMEFLSKSMKGERPRERLSSLLDAVFEKQRKTKFVGG